MKPSLLISMATSPKEAGRMCFLSEAANCLLLPTAAVLPGITRMKVLDVCNSEGIKVNEITLHLADIGSYESVFITGTSRKVLP